MADKGNVELRVSEAMADKRLKGSLQMRQARQVKRRGNNGDEEGEGY